MTTVGELTDGLQVYIYSLDGELTEVMLFSVGLQQQIHLIILKISRAIPDTLIVEPIQLQQSMIEWRISHPYAQFTHHQVVVGGHVKELLAFSVVCLELLVCDVLHEGVQVWG